MFTKVIIISVATTVFGNFLTSLDNNQSGKIVGGTNVTTGEIPWMVSIMREDINELKCGGSIVNTEWIVTAADCVTFDVSNNLYRIRAGSLYLDSEGTLHELTTIIHHENYNRFTKENNIALLRVTPGFVISSTVSPIGLRAQGSFSPIGTSTWVSGWGSTSYAGNISNVLQKANVPIVDYFQCNASLISGGAEGELQANQICAYAPGQNFCGDDFGGPLYYQNELWGIVIWGFRCGETGLPGVYTEASQYTDWILSNAVIP